MELIKPKRLLPGDTIGIIAPASPLESNSELTRSIKKLEQLGFRVVLGENVWKKNEYLAGTDEERASDVNKMFADKNVNAIFVTQGGYGSNRILRYLDWNVIKNNPKVFIGYSDITALHLALQKKTGLVSFHGAGSASLYSGILTPYREEYLLKAIMSEEEIGEIRPAEEDDYIHIIQPGEARGQIVGGCLSLICASLGTPYEIDTKGKILFFEDVDIEPWIFDHLISHLYNAGKLHDAIGFVIGECKNVKPFIHNPGFQVTFSIEEILEDYFKRLGKPTIYGLPLGHTRNSATVPLGMMAYLDATNGRLFIEERGTIE